MEKDLKRSTQSTARDLEIAQTILVQLGRITKLKERDEAKNFTVLQRGIAFTFKGRPYNGVKITLNGLDLYDMKFIFYKWSHFEKRNIVLDSETYSNLFTDQMKQIYENYLY